MNPACGAATGADCTLVFLRAPERGRVKTRLARSLGDEAVLTLYRGFVEDLLETLRQGRQQVVLCCTPSSARAAVQAWIGPVDRIYPQTGDDLGDRMADAFHRAFGEGYRRVLLVGTDLPDLPTAVFQEAFAALARQPAVIGPTLDGGYYLIGFRPETFLPAVFEQIPWSTPAVLAETLAVFGRHGLKVHHLPVWRDIDDLADLNAFAAHPPAGAGPARRTRDILAALDQEGGKPDPAVR